MDHKEVVLEEQRQSRRDLFLIDQKISGEQDLIVCNGGTEYFHIRKAFELLDDGIVQGKS